MQFIPAPEVARLAPYGPLVDALACGLREPIESPPRSHFNPNRDASAVLIMPAWKPGRLMGTKIVSIWPGNHVRGQPAVSAIYVVTSCADGTTLAVLDGTELTLRRTAAAAALASRLLARPDSRRLLVLGTGALSIPMAMAHCSVCDLSRITVWGRDPDKARAVVAALARQGIDADAATDLEQALSAADIVAAATTATTPFIDARWVRPGTHVGLIGAFTAGMAEAQTQLLARSRLFADSRAAVLEKGGEVVQALRAGVITAQDLLAELSELVAQPAPFTGRRSDADITVFKSVGFAALDLIAAEHVLAGMGIG
ncbi:MAG: ornithine cyclodeaminase family protein [Rhodoferax sp.]|jgi:ornithine cyclodeaminase/alanine dehydrogenase-like protein (mu-crystallin family)|nr:ornithine cyclodeaminase family protein [Rhodoferax sp.]